MKNNTVNHEEGTSQRYRLREKFDIEIECLCLNSEYMDIKFLVQQSIILKNEYSDCVIFKESEFHSKKSPYYELSFFCNNDDLEKSSEILKNFGFEIDIVHENKDFR